MEAVLRFSRETIRKFAIVALASLFSLGLYQLWDLRTRWFIVAVGGIAMVSISLCFAQIFSDYLMIVFLFVLPLSSFNKWFWPANYTATSLGNLVYGGVFGLGLLDFLLAGLYLSWFYRVFVARTEPVPHFYLFDLIVVGFLLTHLVASIGAPDLRLAFGATEYFGKHVLLYFYLSRNLRPSHLPWMIAAFCTSIFMEAGFGLYQHATGKLLGFALDKGAGGSALNFQIAVPGLQSVNRATGTSYDAHTLAVFVAMLLPFPLVLALTPWEKGFRRFIYGAIAAMGLLVIFLTYSRSGAIGMLVGVAIGFALILMIWKEGTLIPVVGVSLLLLLVAFPWVVQAIGHQFTQQRVSTIATRWQMYRVALHIWSIHPLFGGGPGNYINELKKYDYLWLDELPVHNQMLWIATETGAAGLFCFIAIFFSAIRRLFRILRRRSDIVGRFAMAALIGLIALFLDLLSDPGWREPDVFGTFWLLISLSIALGGFPQATKRALGESPPPALESSAA